MVSTVFFSALNIGSLVKNSAWRRQNLQKVQTAKLQGVQLESIWNNHKQLPSHETNAY